MEVIPQELKEPFPLLAQAFVLGSSPPLAWTPGIAFGIRDWILFPSVNPQPSALIGLIKWFFF